MRWGLSVCKRRWTVANHNAWLLFKVASLCIPHRDPLWVARTFDGTESYLYYVFPVPTTPTICFIYKLAVVTNNKTEITEYYDKFIYSPFSSLPPLLSTAAPQQALLLTLGS